MGLGSKRDKWWVLVLLRLSPLPLSKKSTINNPSKAKEREISVTYSHAINKNPKLKKMEKKASHKP